MKYFFIGEREIALAFRLVGVPCAVARTREQVLDAFNRATGKGGAEAAPVGEIPRVLILTESAASLIQDEEFAWQKSGRCPLIVEVPGLDGRLEGRKTLTESIAEAIGVNV